MTPWSRATHAQRGKALDDARSQVSDLIDALDLNDPVEAAVVLGLDHLIGLVTETLQYRLGDKPRRDFGAVNDVTLNALAKLKEAAVPVKEAQVDQKLTELGIEPPAPKRRAVRKSKDMSDLWPWYLDYRKTNPNARITCKPDPDGFHRVYARRA